MFSGSTSGDEDVTAHTAATVRAPTPSPVPAPGPSKGDAVSETSPAAVTEPEVVVSETPSIKPPPLIVETEPVRSMRNKNSDKISYAEIDEDDISIKKHRHNLRPQKPNRHVHALKQQAKRRQKNKNVASGAPQAQRTLSRRSTVTSNGEIEIAFKPNTNELENNPQTMKELLNSIPGFNLKKLQLKGQGTKKFTNAQMIQQTKEGSINLDTPESILSKVNLRTLLNKNTFTRLPPLYQFKLMQLLPQCDLLFEDSKGLRLNSSAFNNEFFAKACHEWRERLAKGDFTPEALQKNSSDLSRDKQRLDPWKLRHYEPLWGMKRSYDTNKVSPSPSQPSPVIRTRRGRPATQTSPSSTTPESEQPQRKSERQRKVLSPKVYVECDDVLDAVGAPPVVEESVIVVTSDEIANPVSVESERISDEASLPVSPPESPGQRSVNKSPRVTISDSLDEIQDIYEPVNKKRKTEESDDQPVIEETLIKCFNDPILELDSKYDLSPEETCPENFMESMDEGNELENTCTEDVKTEEEESSIPKDEPAFEEPKFCDQLNEPKCDSIEEETVQTKVEEDSLKTEEESEAEEIPRLSPAVCEVEEAVPMEVAEEESTESEDDSQHAPTLSSVEPLGSVDSSVMSVEMAPPTLSPNYGSPNHEDLSDDNESSDQQDTMDENNDTDVTKDEEDEESDAVESVVMNTEQDLSEEQDVDSVEDAAVAQDSAAADCDKEDVDLDDPPASSPARTEDAATSDLPTQISSFQLPTVPLSLQEAKMQPPSLSPSSSPSPVIGDIVLRNIDPSQLPRTLVTQKKDFVSTLLEMLMTSC